MKRTLALVLAILLLLCAVPVAFADDTGTITIQNTTIGKDYSVYKIFDSTHATGGSPVAYTYKLNGTTDTDALYKALTASGSPFTLTATTVDGVYNVKLIDGKTGADISSFLKTNVIDKELVTPTTKSNVNTPSVEFTGLEYGYYYVTSSLGGTVSLDTTTPTATLIDKNQVPGWDGESGTYPTDAEKNANPQTIGKFVADFDTTNNTAGTYAKSNTAGINDTVSFKINTFLPKYNGDKRVTEYIFTDTLADGFTYVSPSMEVTVDGTTLTMNTDYKVVRTGQELKITISPKSTWDSEPHVSIIYRATVNEKAVYDNVNTVTLTWNETDWNETDDTKAVATSVNPLTSTTDTYVMGFSIDKQDQDSNKLTGAKFKLYDALTGGSEIPVVKLSDGVYRKALANETGVEIEAGEAKIFGFDEGDYYLNETQTPKGYMILEAREKVTISKANVNETGDNAGYLKTTLVIKNTPGKKLPGTGGEGTYAYFIGGGALVLVAAALLLIRRRSASR